MDNKIVIDVTEAVAPIVEKLGYELVEVEFALKYGAMNLTVYIYSAAGISLDDCERVHYAVDPVIDALDPTGGEPFVLNISSAGLDRPIKTARDYARNIGCEVEIRLYAPIDKRKTLEGVLLSDGGLTAEFKELTSDKAFTLEKTKIALLTRLIKF
jgi:ribosome maturation factor RimP